MKKRSSYFQFAGSFEKRFTERLVNDVDQRSTLIYSLMLRLSIVLLIVNTAQDFFVEDISILAAEFIVTGVAILLLIILKKYDFISKVLGFIVVNLAMYYFTIQTLDQSQVSVIFFAIIGCSFLVFGSKQFWLGLVFSIFSFMLVTVAQFQIHAALQSQNSTIKHDLGGILLNIFSAYSLMVITITVLIRMNSAYEKHLLEEKRKIQQANEELDRFVYSMSHDLRAPLNSIKGLVQIAQRETQIDQLPQYFPMIEDRVEKLESFTDDVTNFTRNNRTEINRTSINLKEAINESWNSLQFTDGLSRIKLLLDFSDQEKIQTDKVRFRIILNNLLSNAIKYQDYTKPIEDRKITITFRDDENSFSLIFQDNGIGISEDQLPKMFNMFHRATSQAQGSGLGLFIVKQITEKLNGTIAIESTLKIGTRFLLDFKKAIS